MKIIPLPQYDIIPSEKITRYLFQRGYYAPKYRRVKYNAFLPAPDGKTSVYRITSLASHQIWDIGKRYVAEERKKTLLGRGHIIASDVLILGLEIKPDTEIHLRHANIAGWPTKKSEKKLIAIKLESKAQLHLM